MEADPRVAFAGDAPAGAMPDGVPGTWVRCRQHGRIPPDLQRNALGERCGRTHAIAVVSNLYPTAQRNSVIAGRDAAWRERCSASSGILTDAYLQSRALPATGGHM
jgi:hypothetical protein